MSFAEALGEPVPPPPTFAPLRLPRVADEMASKLGQAANPSPGLDLDAVVERFAAALREGSATLSRVGSRDWRPLPWAFGTRTPGLPGSRRCSPRWRHACGQYRGAG